MQPCGTDSPCLRHLQEYTDSLQSQLRTQQLVVIEKDAGIRARDEIIAEELQKQGKAQQYIHLLLLQLNAVACTSSATIAEKDRQIQRKDTTISDLESACREKDTTIRRMAHELDGNDTTIKGMQRLINAMAQKLGSENTQAVLRKLNARFFFRLKSALWSNSDAGVNQFVSRVDDPIQTQFQRSTKNQFVLTKLMAGDNKAAISRNSKFRAFGFCYVGLPIVTGNFRKIEGIQEAYGVEKNQIQYVVVILSRNNGRRLGTVAHMVCDLIDENLIKVEDSHHVSVYIASETNSDIVLANLKEPNPEKWAWARYCEITDQFEMDDFDD